ncbi:Transcriptional regulator, TetR family protein [Minicystis rosea]|nr:Transcriptional regulator, TetR family protein [Minicystis rosea]
MDTPDTRVRILRAALEEFGAHGYQSTSIQAIAAQVGVSKAAVLYHFKSKDEILAALTAPMLDAMEAAIVAAEMAAPSEAGWKALTGLLEVWLSHRYLLRMSLHDLSLVHGSAFERYRDAALRANALLAGPKPDLAAKVRAAQALAMTTDPVVLFADEPTARLRDLVLTGVRRLLDRPAPPAETKRTTARRGRKSVMSPQLQAKALRLRDRGASADTIAAELGVSRATVYRFLRQ